MIIDVFYWRNISVTPIMMKPFQYENAHPLAAPSNWSQRMNPAVREMLDHIAEELAKEYVRLLKASAEKWEAGK
jgi:lysophospholipase L1-like esterase